MSLIQYTVGHILNATITLHYVQYMLFFKFWFYYKFVIITLNYNLPRI